MNDQIYFDNVAQEIKQGSIDGGLWARALCDAEGNKDKAEALYVRFRVNALVESDGRNRPKSQDPQTRPSLETSPLGLQFLAAFGTIIGLFGISGGIILLFHNPGRTLRNTIFLDNLYNCYRR
ncbi:MAG TPA: hypothetical protein EYQ50_23675 [Verrucomicrobiales bacterium]|nr:hypothetical protein [Verrucomicrobiales bacterium]